MIDINLIRDNPEEIRKKLLKRNYEVSFNELILWDDKRRELINISDTKKAKKNKVSKQIPLLRKSGDNIIEILMEDLKTLSEEIKVHEMQVKELNKKIKSFLDVLPNIPVDDVISGGKKNNSVIRSYKKQRKFDFKPKNHIELAENLGLIDYKRGAKLGGNGFWIYTDKGARLEWALLKLTNT